MAFRQWVRAGSAARLLASLVLMTAATGCMSGAQVHSKQLPVKRVVVYRNGVAYFERSGEVDTRLVHFQLREENVGDFLATLAVLEKGGQTVRAASFPVALEEDQEYVDPELEQALNAWDHKERENRKLRTVTIELGDGKHELSVGYLAETPLWRPSYRLVVGKDGKAVLQAWGIVQNQSGEDWRDVEIALVAGAPIAFESTLGEPVIPRRPVVTDRGEVIAAVPRGDTTYATRDEADKDEEAEVGAADSRAPRRKGAPMAPAADMAAEDGAYSFEQDPLSAERGVTAPSAAPPPAPSMKPRDSSALARVELQTGATRYEVPHRVTIPDQSATMVLMVSKEVPGEAVFLFAPDGGVPDSYAHPFRVARFKNLSGGMLERGPIAVFEEGAFLGQGVVESLPNEAQATVPFALMRSLSIRKESSTDQRGARVYSVKNGQLTIENDQAMIFAYHVENGDPEKARVLVKHHLSYGSELANPPAGTETLAGANEVLAPVDVAGFGKASLMLEERHPVRRQVDFRTSEARLALRDFIKSGAASSEQAKLIEEIIKFAAQLETLDDQETRLTREQRELERSTEETRHSLRAIKDNNQAAALRRELTDRLAEGTRRLDAITKDLVELRMRRTEQEVRLKDARQSLNIEPPDRREKKAAAAASGTAGAPPSAAAGEAADAPEANPAVAPQ